jgi:hypothetical protein
VTEAGKPRNIKNAQKAIYYVDLDQSPEKLLEDILTVVGQIQAHCKAFLTHYGYKGIKAKFYQLSTTDVIRTYSRDIEKMVFLDGVTPNIFRQASALAIWITRLKPLAVVEVSRQMPLDEHKDWMYYNINELFAVYLAATLVFAHYLGEKDEFINDKHFKVFKVGWSRAYSDVGGLKELVSTLHYRLISRHSLSNFLEMDFMRQKEIALLRMKSD